MKVCVESIKNNSDQIYFLVAILFFKQLDQQR